MGLIKRFMYSRWLPSTIFIFLVLAKLVGWCEEIPWWIILAPFWLGPILIGVCLIIAFGLINVGLADIMDETSLDWRKISQNAKKAVRLIFTDE